MLPCLSRKTTPGVRLAFWVITLTFLSCLVSRSASGAGPSVPTNDFFFEQPPESLKKAEALLTPRAAIIATPTGTLENNPSSVVLLEEVVHVVDESGRALRLHQVAYRALTEAGAKAMGEDIFSYRHHQQNFHLVCAETIQPDGTAHAVAREAVLMQSPQRQADSALYDDQAEVRIIYPNVKVGCITRVIIAVDDQVARMPNAYTYRFTWGAGWPTRRERLLVDLPANLAGKLRHFTLGADIPQPTLETLPDGRVRLSWLKTDMPASPREIARAPASQNGPWVHLTTLASWDEFGAWFAGLLSGRDQLPVVMQEQLAEWTRGISERDAIIRVLFTKVANDVRYTGLELGDADYQPYPCEAVWAKRYGDCKDKANLLVALLRAKGISAHLTLLNTTHVGRVDRRVPDFRVFTHAIVAIPDDHGGYLFCDPTIAWAEPGLISPSDADRDVLIIKNGGIAWAHTPPQTAGKLTYDFDLKLAATGEMSGWLTLTADGYYGAGQRERYRGLDTDDCRRALSDTVRGFYPGAEVIDVAPLAPLAAELTDTMKAYFVVPVPGSATEPTRSLNFPKSNGLLLDLGTTSQRESAFFLYQEDIRVTAKIALPSGLAPTSLPSPYQVETPTGSSECRWTHTAGLLEAKLNIQLRQSVLPATEFPRFYQAMLSLRTWLDQPLALSASAEVAPTAAPVSTELDLPLMPSGSGQIDLVDKRYPSNGNLGLRRAALLRTLQYFPNDKVTVFHATARLAWLDWNADHNQEALDRLAPLLPAYENDVTPELYSWAENIHGLALRDLKRSEDALAIFLRLATDTRLSAERRTEAAFYAANLSQAPAPSKVIASLIATCELVSSWQPDAFAALARLQLPQDPDGVFRGQVTQLLRTQPEAAEGILRFIIKSSSNWNDPGAEARQTALVQLVTELRPQPGPELQAALNTAQARLVAFSRFEKIRCTLSENLQTPELNTWYSSDSSEPPADAEKFKQAIKAAEDKKDSNQSVRLSVRALVTLPPGADFSDRLWRAISYADWHERLVGRDKPWPILPLLLDLCDQLPETEHGYFEGRYLRAAYFARRDNYRGAYEVLSALAKNPRRPETFHDSAFGRLGGTCEKLGDYVGALAAYAELEKPGASSEANADCLLHAVLIQLHQNQPGEALRLIGLLEKASEATLSKTTGEYFIRELIALRRSGQAEAFWLAHTSWWPRWQSLETKLRLPPAGLETIVPMIPDLTDLGRTLGSAARAKDPTTFLKHYRQLISASRWLPSLAPEVAGLMQTTGTILPGQIADIRNLVIAQLEVPAVSLDNLRVRQLYLADQYQGAGRFNDALKVATSFHSIAQPDDVVTRSLHRVWGMAARSAKRQLAEAAAPLARDLANPDMADSRGYAVELLADLYRLNGRPDAEAALLARELANPQIIAASNTHANLTERQKQLGGSTRLTRQIGIWLQQQSFPWYDFAEPTSLKDPRLRNLEEVLRNPSRLFTPVQVIKLNLLLAQSSEGSSESQRKAFIDAYQELLRLAVTHAQAWQLANSVLAEGQFDPRAADHAAWNNRRRCLLPKSF